MRRSHMFSNDGSIEYARVVAKSWIDPEFREKLIADPKAALGEHGIPVPDDVVISVMPGAERTRVELALPARPEMSDEVLERKAASSKTKADSAKTKSVGDAGKTKS